MESGEASKGAAPLQIDLLGAFAVCVHGRTLPKLRARQGQWLLALLVLRADRQTEREQLASTLWPDSSPEQALYNLRRNLTDLRHALGVEADRLHSHYSQTLRLDLTGARVDVAIFDHLLKRGDAPSLAQAVELYRGELLEGCLEEWILPEREARAQAYLAALETLAEQASARQDPASAARYLRRILLADPLRESALRALLEALAARGEGTALTQAYRDFRLYLYREMHVDPDAETVALYERLKPGTSVRPVQTKTVPTPPRAKGNLPRPLSRLIGREEETAQVAAALRSARLLTLTGAGGVGKTRLAIAAAEAAANDYAEGIFFVDLAPLTEAAFVTHAAAAALEVREEPGRSLIETLKSALAGKRLLLLLDNCEHLVGECAQFVHALLLSCPDLRVLATSRQSLGLTGEVPWQVPSLPFPPPYRGASGPKGAFEAREGAEKNALSILLEYPSVRLFVDLAGKARPKWRLTLPDAEIIGAICRQLDGIPLAIELAAARVRAMSVQQIARRLNRVFPLLTGGSAAALPRHQTLEGLIDWSYNLLSEAEQALFQRLSVFAGGWSLEAAEFVCAGEREEGRGTGEWRQPHERAATRSDRRMRRTSRSLAPASRREGRALGEEGKGEKAEGRKTGT
jgi:predicted ATPase/DNA-binding SARP family transcriptional activator